MQLSWIYYDSDGRYVADLVGPGGGVKILKADSIEKLRFAVLSQIADQNQCELADDLFTEFMAGQITNAIMKLEKMRARLKGIAA